MEKEKETIENENKEIEQIITEKSSIENHGPNKEKAYPIRNFFKELKRVSWPLSKKNYKYLFLVFVFIIFLVAFFAFISWGVTEFWKLIGVS